MEEELCSYCHGQLTLTYYDEIFNSIMEQTCPHCRGTGWEPQGNSWPRKKKGINDQALKAAVYEIQNYGKNKPKR